MRQPPNSKRTLDTYEVLLLAAQNILVSEGYDALNSNLIVKRAGKTPPTFYRYFDDKFEVLEVLCHRVMNVQNELILGFKLAEASDMKLEQLIQMLVSTTIAVTKDFRAGAELIKILRIVPRLQPIIINSHNEMALYIADHIVPVSLNLHSGIKSEDILLRARLAIQFGYATLEHLLSENLANEDVIIERTANAMAGIFLDIGKAKN